MHKISAYNLMHKDTTFFQILVYWKLYMLIVDSRKIEPLRSKSSCRHHKSEFFQI